MANTGYSLLIIDDQFRDRKEDYERILMPDFALSFTKNQYEIESDIDKAYDGYILDLILRPDFSISSKDVLSEYLARKNAPVFLLSARWKTDDDVISLLREMAIGNPQVVELLDWKDFIASKSYSRSDVISSIKLPLDKWYRREGRSPSNRKEITILHVSDCQIGDPEYSFVSQGVDEHIADTLNEISNGADLVIVSGDIAYSATPQQYDDAVNWSRKLIESSLGEEFEGSYEDRFLVVPGNHDVDLCAMGSDSIEYTFSKDEYPIEIVKKGKDKNRHPNGELKSEIFPRAKMGLSSFEYFSQQVTTFNGEGSFGGAYVENYLNWGIDLVLVSTVGLASILDTQVVGTPQSVLDKISKQARRNNKKDRPYRILVTHHPPPEVLGADPEETAHWHPKAWEVFRGWIGRLKPDLWLAGHTHAGEATVLGSKSGKEGLPCIVAPTLTLKQSARGEDALRGFAVLRLILEEERVSEAIVEWYDLKGSNEPKRDDSRTKTFKRNE